jgi:hypothetical protein
MTIDSNEDIKTALAALKEREATTRRSRPPADHHPAPAPAQNELAELQSLLNADPNLGKLGDILAGRLDGQRQSLLAQQDRGRERRQTEAAAAAATAGINARRQALSILAQPFTPPYYVVIDTPFLIWELPNPNLSMFLGSGIEAGGSWVKILLDTQHTPDWETTDFVFYFLWENPTDYYAVANVSSSLSLNGRASALGSSGIFSGNYAQLYLEENLTVIRWSGWGTDPDTGQSNDQTPYPVYDQSQSTNVADLNGFGGDWFNSAKPAYATFYPQTPYDVSASLIAIPGQAVTVFEVDLHLAWWFRNDHFDTVDNQPQSISLDLASDALGYMVQCPMVQLQLLTAPPA